MTGLLVALLVIVTAALCFILGMLFGAWIAIANPAGKGGENK
jgi:hypothetical protein